MAERIYGERELRDESRQGNRGFHADEDDSRRAFPLAAGAFGATLFLFILLIVNWVC